MKQKTMIQNKNNYMCAAEREVIILSIFLILISLSLGIILMLYTTGFYRFIGFAGIIYILYLSFPTIKTIFKKY